VKGNSQTKIKEYAIENPAVKCDLWSIDGDHGPNAELDFEGYTYITWRFELSILITH
jgi:hypothetical protein